MESVDGSYNTMLTLFICELVIAVILFVLHVLVFVYFIRERYFKPAPADQAVVIEEKSNNYAEGPPYDTSMTPMN